MPRLRSRQGRLPGSRRIIALYHETRLFSYESSLVLFYTFPLLLLHKYSTTKNKIIRHCLQSINSGVGYKFSDIGHTAVAAVCKIGDDDYNTHQLPLKLLTSKIIRDNRNKKRFPNRRPIRESLLHLYKQKLISALCSAEDVFHV